MRVSSYRLVILVMAAVMVYLFLIYSHGLVSRLEETNRLANETIARFWAGTQIPLSLIMEERRISVCSNCGSAVGSAALTGGYWSFCKTCGEITWHNVVDRWTDEERERILSHTSLLFRDLVGRLGYTTILADLNSVPQIVNGEPLPDSISDDDLVIWREVMHKLSDFNPPIPVVTVDEDTIGWLFYGVDNLNRELTVVPFVELGMLLLLGGLLLLGIRVELRREKEMSWVGFAKETAHQLSTPISSLMGWVEILRQRNGIEGPEDPEILEAAVSMEADIARLNQIVQRYGEMGKKPRLAPADINAEIGAAMDYFRNRPGLVFKGVSFETSLEATRGVMLNRVLFGWVLENLVKNSLSALSDTPSGIVSICTADRPEKGGMVEVQVTDNGRGISHGDHGRVFQPGFTTRRGGWGLGLTLSRRIIEEYHSGSLRLVASSPGKGSTFSIMLPAVEEAGGAGPDDDTVG